MNTVDKYFLSPSQFQCGGMAQPGNKVTESSLYNTLSKKNSVCLGTTKGNG